MTDTIPKRDSIWNDDRFDRYYSISRLNKRHHETFNVLETLYGFLLFLYCTQSGNAISPKGIASGTTTVLTDAIP
ncbi:MAG TPA: hypothetical protein ENI48_06180 [Thioploca sp.]|nr:hypothetical protein [Thioploca sp.]